VRRLLRRGAETLTDAHRRRIDTALQAGDPDWEVTVAWACAQQLRAVYHAPTPEEGRRCAERVLDNLHACPSPEVARLGRRPVSRRRALRRGAALSSEEWFEVRLGRQRAKGDYQK
jgi:hypothetical protein